MNFIIQAYTNQNLTFAQNNYCTFINKMKHRDKIFVFNINITFYFFI